MNGALLAILVVMGGPATGASDPAALVAELGSPRFVQREAAESALGRLGRAALPALRSSQESTDPEIRTRSLAILRRIEGALLVEPTMVTLDLTDTSLVEAIATINRQADLPLRLTPELPPLWTDRRVSVHAAGPLPFWKALDVFCEAGQLHYVFGGQNDFESGQSSFALFDGFAAHQGIYNDQGPFRVQLASLHYQSEVHLSHDQPGDRVGIPPSGSPRPRSLPSKQFFLQMLVGAEPRLSVATGGPVRALEAIDDQGRSLVPPSRPEFIQHESGYLGVNSSPLVHLRVDLVYPDGPVARLKKVTGLIPLVVSTRRPDPLDIPLTAAAHQTFRRNDVAITVGEVRIGQPDQAATIELAIKATTPNMRDVAINDEAGEIQAVASPQQLEVLDAAGRMIPWFPSSSFFNGEEAKLTLTLLDRGAPFVPSLIRYHGLIRDRTEVPFEFRDLPMP